MRMGGVALIESNFFENALNPVTSRYSDEVGFWDLRNNHVGPGITWAVEEPIRSPTRIPGRAPRRFPAASWATRTRLIGPAA